MSDIHPAALANMNSMKYAMASDKESWLVLFAEDAELYDPVGPSPFDKEGKGHHGKAAIANFWDMVIGPANLTMVAHERYPCGNSCPVSMTVTNDLGNGLKTTIPMLGLYEVNDEGKLISLKVFWEWDKLKAQLKELGVM